MDESERSSRVVEERVARAMKRLILLGFALCLLSGFGITEASSNPGCDLVQAIINNDIDGARRLIASGIDVNSECAGALPLSMASEYGRTEIVYPLIEAHAKIDAVDATSRTALHWAAANGRAGVVSALIAGGADVQRNDVWGRAPLDLASRNGHLEATRVLIKAGAKVAKGKPDVLSDAVASGNREIVQLLLDAGADPLGHAENGRSAFSDAGTHCNVDVLRLLVQRSAGRKERLFSLGKALLSAARNGNRECLKFLLHETPADVNFRVDSAGKQVSINENGSCALGEAARDSDEEVVRFLLEAARPLAATNMIRIC
jgi:ankyrin repeat protein